MRKFVCLLIIDLSTANVNLEVEIVKHVDDRTDQIPCTLYHRTCVSRPCDVSCLWNFLFRQVSSSYDNVGTAIGRNCSTNQEKRTAAISLNLPAVSAISIPVNEHKMSSHEKRGIHSFFFK